MNTNIFSEYYEYKLKTLYEYSILIAKILGIKKNKLWNKKKILEENLKYIIKDYLDNNLSSQSNYDLIRMFITDKDVYKYKMNNEIKSSINYFIEKQRVLEIKAYEKEIILSASVLSIANTLDVSTSPYKNNKYNYKTIVIGLLEKFNKIPYFINIDNGKKCTNELIELVKSNVKKERKIFEYLNSNISFNKYVDISEENKYYLTQYNYSIQNVKNINAAALKYVYSENNVDDKFVLISKDMALVTLMKLLSVQKLRKIFFLPTKKEFYENEVNIKELSNISNNKYSNRFIKILINSNDFDLELKKILNRNNIDYYLYCSKSTNLNEINTDEKNYLFSREFNEINSNLLDEFKKNNKNVIVEKYGGLVLDSDLISEMEEN